MFVHCFVHENIVTGFLKEKILKNTSFPLPDHLYYIQESRTWKIIFIIIIIIRVFWPKASPSLQAQEPRLQFCRRQVFHRKLRNVGYSFTRDLIGTVASRCFPHPTLSLASEQILKDLKRSQGNHVEVRSVDLTNWAVRTSPKFTTEFKYLFHKGSWPDQRSRNLG